jgi:hypothetical protein
MYSILKKLKILKKVPDPENYSIRKYNCSLNLSIFLIIVSNYKSIKVIRFLGTTPASSNMKNTLNSIIYQISKIYKLKTPPVNLVFNATAEMLKNYLYEQFLTILSMYPNKKLIIILDSIDQLNSSDYSLDWFLEMLPLNVKMIYSTLTKYGDILDRLSAKKALTEENYVKIHSLDINVSKTILKDWLSNSQRSITSSQWNVLDEMFAKITLYPLYIKLIFDVIVTWPSNYEPDADFLKCKTIDKCIKYLFRSLEKSHGKLLFSRSIIYFSSFRNGVSENEIVDILSLDDDVLFDIFEVIAYGYFSNYKSLFGVVFHIVKHSSLDCRINIKHSA